MSIIKPRNQSDRTCFRNITSWLMAGCAAGKFNEQIFDRVLDCAKEASLKRNPTAVFVSLLKKKSWIIIEQRLRQDNYDIASQNTQK